MKGPHSDEAWDGINGGWRLRWETELMGTHSDKSWDGINAVPTGDGDGIGKRRRT